MKGDVARLVKLADEGGGRERRARDGRRVARIGPQVAVAQIVGREQRQAAREVEEKIAPRGRPVARRPEDEPAPRGRGGSQ